MPSAGGLQLGLFLNPEAARHDELVAQARLADEAGIDQFQIQDHPYQRRHLDALSLIADLAARTERLRFVTAVANLPLRHPAMLAKQAASLSVMSGGRFDLGLGAGAFWDPVVAMGGPRRTPKESVDALEEAIAICRAAWGDDHGITSDGPFYPLGGYRPGPTPPRSPQLWLGAYGPRMLRITGRSADGWIPSSPYAPPTQLPEMQDRIDEAATDAGRDPRSVVRAYVIQGSITDGSAEGDFDGPVARWVEQLVHLHRDLRFDSVSVWPQGDVDAQVRRFIEEVAPAVRAALA